MSKIKITSEIRNVCQWFQKQGETVGLVTGCYDIIHLGHISVLNFAKKNVDLLIVGLDSDQTIKLSKHPDRPVFPQSARLKIMAELKKINFVFGIKMDFHYSSSKAEWAHEQILTELKPDYLISCPLMDSNWQVRKARAEKHGVKFLPQRRKRRLDSSTNIIRRIQKFGKI